MPVELGSAYGKIEIDGSGVGAGLAEAQRGLQGFQDSVGAAGRALMTSGAVMTAAVTVPLMAIGKQAITTAGDFEAQMNILDLAARASGTGMEDLRQAAILVGADTQLVGVSASEAAEAMTGFYKAGLTTTDIFGDLNTYLVEGTDLTGALRAAVDLAAASDLSLAQASDAVAIAMATFGLSAEDATSIADSFVRTADASVTNVAELTQAMAVLGPTAAAFGWSLDDTNVALGILSERGIRGAEAGTSLKSMMTNLMRPTDDVTATLKAMGVSLYDAQGQMLSLPEIMAQLEVGMAGMSEEQRNQTIVTLAGTYGMKAMQTLLAEGSDGWNDMATSVAGAATAQDVAEGRTRGFNAAIEQLQGAVETFMVQTMQPFIEEYITPFIQKITEALGAIIAQNPEWVRWAVVIAAAVAALGPVLMAIGVLATVLGAVLSPIGLVIAAVAALAAAWALNIGGVRDFTMQAWGRIREAIQGVIDWIAPYISSFLMTIRGWWAENGEAILATAGRVWGAVQSVVGTVLTTVVGFVEEQFGWIVRWVQTNWPLIQATITTVLDRIWGVVSTVVAAISQFWQDHGEQLMAAARSVWGIISTVVSTVIKTIFDIIKAVMQMISGDWSGAWETIKGIFVRVKDALLSIAGDLFNLLSNVFVLITNFLRDVWAKAGDWLKETTRGVISWIEGAWEAAKLWLAKTWEDIGKALKSAWESARQWVIDRANAIVDAVRNLWSGLVQAGANLIAGLREGIRNAWDGFLSWLNNILKTAVDAVKKFFGIASPSTVFEGIGQNLVAGLMRPFEGLTIPVQAMINRPNLGSLAASVAGGMGAGQAGAGRPGGNVTVYGDLLLPGVSDKGSLVAELQGLMV